MFEEKIKDLVISSLVVDSYCLGTHWVYDEEQLINNSINWNGLNAPIALWHKGKLAGDFTHYGDQTLWLYEFLKDKNSFMLKLMKIFGLKKCKLIQVMWMLLQEIQLKIFKIKQNLVVQALQIYQ